MALAPEDKKSRKRSPTATRLGIDSMASFIPFIPTDEEEVRVFFELAPVAATDVVYDLGSGDGRLVFGALDSGAGKAVGVELDAALVHETRATAIQKGVEDRVTFLAADVMDVDLSPATVVLFYLISRASAALKPKLEAELKPGTRVVVESFPVRGWKAVKTKHVGHATRTFYLYVMPPEKEHR